MAAVVDVEADPDEEDAAEPGDECRGHLSNPCEDSRETSLTSASAGQLVIVHHIGQRQREE